MSERFSEKVVLIAGGTGGLGRAVSLAFLEEGAKVAVTYQDQNELDSLRGAAGVRVSSLEGIASTSPTKRRYGSWSRVFLQRAAAWTRSLIPWAATLGE